MVPVLALLFLATPLIEIALFIQVGGWLGLWPTLALVVITAVAGVTLLRAQGLRTITRARTRIERREAPIEEIFDGLCLAVAAVCLLTPGFFTDAVGVALADPRCPRASSRLCARAHGGPHAAWTRRPQWARLSRRWPSWSVIPWRLWLSRPRR